ncbi:mCG117600, isoform CRA_a, partial [Mus musculus]
CKCLTDASLLKYFPPILKNLKPATLTEIAKIFKVGHLDFSNLWCGEYPCSSCLTSLFEGTVHSRAIRHLLGVFSSRLQESVTSERTSDWPRQV